VKNPPAGKPVTAVLTDGFFTIAAKRGRRGPGRPGGCFPETVSGFGQLAPHVPQTQHGPPRGQGSVEQEIVRGETERRRGGESRSDVVEV